MTVKDAMAFVQSQGIVLESGHGPVPNLAETIAGEHIRGSWWGHSKGRSIFAATRAIRGSPDILVCRLLGGKVTYIHRRLWPAVVRLADKFGNDLLTAIREEHTDSGSHRVVETPFPLWVSPDVKAAADQLSLQEARRQLGEPVFGSLCST